MIQKNSDLNRKFSHGSLFSGIGGFDLAAEWVGWINVFQVENDKFCNKVLKKNFSNVKRYGDIKEFKGQPGQCDIISGGVPCQPASIAGKRQGTKDDRWLWPEAIRIVREIKPAFAVFENPTGILSLENGRPFDWILTSLENEGYTVESFIIPACSIGAWHRRNRVWIIAYRNSNRKSNVSINEKPRQRELGENVSDTTKQGLQGSRPKSRQQKIQQENRTEQFRNDANSNTASWNNK